MLIKKSLIAPALALTAALFVPKLRAQMTPLDNPNPYWFSFGPQFSLNINARFNHIGNLSSASAGPATGGDLNRTYDDGFVHVDSSGDAGGQSWNWGYQNASQVQGSTLVMHSASAAADATLKDNDNPQDGFDLAFGRDLGALLGGKWGLQGAFDFTAMSIQDHQPFSGAALMVSDAYSLGGVIPPPAPYTGSFNGPGPLLNDTPTRTTATVPMVITGSRTLDAQVYVLRAGPYYEFLFGKGWSGRLGGGLALTEAATQYSFDEAINLGGGVVFHHSGYGSGAQFQAGAYLEGRLLYAFAPHASVFGGVQYENLGTFSRSAGNEAAQLDLNSAVYVLFGVQINF